MKVLHLTPELPFAPGGTGGSTRQFHLLRALAARGHDVTVVAPVHHTQHEGAAVLRAAGVELLGPPRPRSRAREAADAVLQRPGLVARALSDPVLAWQTDVLWTRLRAHAAAALAERPDVVVIEHDWALRWRGVVPAGVPVVGVLQNVTSAYYESRAADAEGPRRAALLGEARRFARFDRARLRGFDRLVAVSELDREAAVPLAGGVPIAVVPNGVDTTAMPAAPDPGRPVVLYPGTMSYPPNAEGLRWLLREIWPLVRERVPGAELVVLGKGAPQDAVAMAGPGVTFTGWVEAVPPYFAQAAIVLVPVRSGGGTRLKVLDALSSGRPIVSTRVGAEGIAVQEGVHVRFADEPAAFASSVASLLGDPEARAAMGAAGRELAVARYDWGSLGAALEAVLEEARG